MVEIPLNPLQPIPGALPSHVLHTIWLWNVQHVLMIFDINGVGLPLHFHAPTPSDATFAHLGIREWSNSHNGGNVPLKDHPPEALPGVVQGVLRHDELWVKVVAFHYAGIDVVCTR